MSHKNPIYITKDNLTFSSSIKNDIHNVTHCEGEDIVIEENTDVVIVQEYDLKFSGGEKRLLVQTKKTFKLKNGDKCIPFRWVNADQIKLKQEDKTLNK